MTNQPRLPRISVSGGAFYLFILHLFGLMQQ